MTTILKATLAILTRLEVIGKRLMKKGKLQELRALSACSFRCQSYMTSVDVMQNRVSKLIDLV